MTRNPIPLEELPVFYKYQTDNPGEEFFKSGAVIPFDKPPEMTSFSVVKFVRNRIPARKVGHAGTLDPLATGLLILCCGKATKSISQVQDLPKTYVAEITFGASTPSYDRATEIDETADWNHIDPKKIDGEWVVHVNGGRVPTEKRAVAWAQEVEERGAGEILLTSMDRDGTKSGYDIELTRAISDAVNIPVIASGGAGSKADFAEALTDGGADAALAASLFHYNELRVGEVKAYLDGEGVPVRLSGWEYAE